MAGANSKYTADEVIDAIRRGHTASGASRLLGCVPQTVNNYAARMPTVAAELKEQRRQLIDLAELSLRKAVLEGQPWAVALVLKTIGKGEGYTERVELTGADGGTLQVEYVNDWRTAGE